MKSESSEDRTRREFIVEAVRLACAAGLGSYALAFPSIAVAEDAVKATHIEIKSIGLDKATKFQKLSAFCLNGKGNLLACDSMAKVIKVISPKGKLLKNWKLEFGPTRIRTASDATVYVGGKGVMARLSKEGKVLKTAKSEGENFPSGKVSGIAVSDKYVFVSFGSGRSLGAKAVIVRFDRNLGVPKQIAKGLRGCCQRLDLAVKGDKLYVAENARHRLVCYDADGKVLATWGKRERTDIKGFGSCCNPMNIVFGPKGELYTAESGLGRIKRYTAEGKFLGLVGEVGVQRFTRASGLAASCSNITVSVSKDGQYVFVQDVKTNLIRVLKAKGSAFEPAKSEDKKAADKES